jgi:membrane-bound serine protease (ClpP class)
MHRTPPIPRCRALLIVACTAFAATFLHADVEPPRFTGGKGAILTLHDEITDISRDSLQRRIDEARAAGATTLILDMNTPGGLVDSSIEIADLLRNLEDIRTVAWVNNTAHSGGALVACACDEIVMTRSSRIGDSQVIMGGPGGATAIPKELEPKVYTPVIHDFRTSARRNGYSLVLAEAFVVPEREVWWVENKKTKEREFVFKEEKERRIIEPAKPLSDASTADSPPSDWTLVETYPDVLLGKDVEARQPVVTDYELLQMSPSEAIAYGFAKAVVSDEAELRERYQLTDTLRLAPLWSENLALWLTSVYVRGFLLMVIVLSAYVEFHTPGVGLAGLTALIALAIFVGAPYLAGLANAIEIILIVLGIGLIAVELFVIPGFGVVGFAGLGLVLVGLLATFVPDEPGRPFPLLFPSLPSTVEAIRVALTTVVTALSLSFVGMIILSRYLPKMPLFNRLAPANPTPSQVYADDPYVGAARVHDRGLTEGPLRPAGKARFGPIIVDVVTQGEFLDAATPVEVIERRGNRVVVRAMGPPSA